MCRFISALFLALASQAATPLASDPVGAHRLTLVSGPNFISTPLHGAVIHVGIVQSVTATGLTLTVNPGWSTDQLGPRDGFPQYLVLIRTDVSATPGVQGDWWTVDANTAQGVTLATRGENLTGLVSPGDTIEVRRLMSFQNLFGSGTTLRLLPDANLDPLSTEEDVIRFVAGASFGSEVFYHIGGTEPSGYYLNGSLFGTGDGSTLTLLPDQPLVIFHKTGAPSLELLLTGSVIGTTFSHYLLPGPNAVGVVYPVPGLLESSRLKESGWRSDINFDVLTTEEDVLRVVKGTSFAEEIFHYAGVEDIPGWYVNGVRSTEYSFEPTTGLMFFIHGDAMLRWRQNVGFPP